MLATTTDRELQFLLLKIAAACGEKPKFKHYPLENDYDKIDIKSFKKMARPFLDKVDVYHKKKYKQQGD